MTTLNCVSTSADGIRQAHEPLISVATIIDNLGTHPAVTVPMFTGEAPDVDWVWDYLAEPADFFGLVMPGTDELRAASERFTTSAAAGADHTLLAVTIVLIEVNGRLQFTITGVPACRFDPTPVRIAVGCDASWPAPGATDPLWRRMAARTTSRGEVDQRRRWCDDNGYVDQLASPAGSLIGRPALGALVFDNGDDLIGVDRPGPTGSLRLLAKCGAIRAGMITESIELVDPAQVSSAWWISPNYGLRPVDGIGDTSYPVESSSPPLFLGRMT